jgi:hypothetical protein
MNAIELIGHQMLQLHEAYDTAVEGLDEEKIHWLPGKGCNHIAFLLWHYLRTEDNIVQFVIQRKPTVWIENKWDSHFDLDSKVQGTGMNNDEARTIRLSSLPDFKSYMNQIWKSTNVYLDATANEDIERETKLWPFGERAIRQIFSDNLINHGFSHLGEIWAIRGLLGLKGSPF